jgi:hypothetical protein
VDEIWLWHRSLGHINFDNLVKFNNLGAVRNLPKIIKASNVMCRHCQLGKQTRIKFKAKEYTTSKPLELAHTDLCGPTRTKILQGESFFMLFINDFTRMGWICFLKKKSEALNKFKALKTLVENEKGTKIKCLRSDNGGEFTSKYFDLFCETHEIKRQFYAARTPHENGIVERKNRTVQEAARTMLNEAKLSYGYWREVVSTTVYILNRAHLSVNSDNTPYELCFGRTPSVKYFKVFGSKCYIKRLDESLRKFDSRSDEGIFPGYASNNKAYRCYNIRSHKIVESADVKVDELKTIRIKNQETISKNEDEDDDEIFDTQLEKVEENEKEREEGDMDMSESEEDSQYGEIREEFLRRYTKTPSIIIQKNHPEELIIGDMNDGVHTIRQLLYQTKIALLSHVEPSSIKEACKYVNWINAMNEELDQIEKNQTWELVPRPKNKNVIGTKWVHKNKMNEDGKVIKNKARLL